MMAQIARPGTFPLQEAIREAPRLYADADFAVYSCADVSRSNLSKITYFALSIFWRASVHRWRVQDRQIKIELGPYTEPIRKFLKGTGGFPQNTFLIVTVTPSPKPDFALIRPVRLLPRDFHLFVFYIPGVQFLLCTGRQVPDNFKDGCIHHSPKHVIWFDEKLTGQVIKGVTIRLALSNSSLKKFFSGHGETKRANRADKS